MPINQAELSAQGNICLPQTKIVHFLSKYAYCLGRSAYIDSTYLLYKKSVYMKDRSAYNLGKSAHVYHFIYLLGISAYFKGRSA